MTIIYFLLAVISIVATGLLSGIAAYALIFWCAKINGEKYNGIKES